MKVKTLNYTKGKNGEEEAKIFLLDKGYCLIEMNYRTDVGEIDLIMSEGDTLVFVEVKMKTDDLFGLPEEMISKHKLSQVRRVAEIYLLVNPIMKHKFPKQRIDAVCILNKDIRHYINVY